MMKLNENSRVLNAGGRIKRSHIEGEVTIVDEFEFTEFSFVPCPSLTPEKERKRSWLASSTLWLKEFLMNTMRRLLRLC